MITECGLSEREIDVLRLAATGAGNEEIGQQLGISRHTVKNHLTHVYEKLACKSRTQAVLIAVRRGWVANRAAKGGRRQSPLLARHNE